jgi:hypothetical protein
MPRISLLVRGVFLGGVERTLFSRFNPRLKKYLLFKQNIFNNIARNIQRRSQKSPLSVSPMILYAVNDNF